MKRILVGSLIAALLCSLVAGEGAVYSQPATQGLPTAKPAEVGMSAERLGHIRTAMQRYVDRNVVPGVVTLVARRGRQAQPLRRQLRT